MDAKEKDTAEAEEDFEVEIEQNPEEEMKIEYMDVDDVVVAPWNPASRVSEHSLRDLCEQIRDVGRVLSPLQITEDGILSDGHGRLKCAKMLGIRRVPVIHQKGFTSVDLWRALNTGVRKVGSKDYFQAIVIHNAPYDIVQQEYFRFPIEWLVTHLGLDLAREIAEKGYSPGGIYKAISAVVRYCQRQGEDAFAQFVARWIVANRQSYSVRKAIEDGIDPGEILLAIDENRKIEHVWRVDRE